MKENKLIAEFMGYELVGNTYSKNNGMNWFIEPQYHKDWNWLMPVVDKMNTTELWDEYDISYLATYLVSVDINATYNAVVEFINEYNKENESND